MAAKSLSDIAKLMKDIDFAMLSTKSEGGTIASRPMSNNRDVEYFGDSYFFTTAETGMVAEIEADPLVALNYTGSKGLLGKPPVFVSVEGEAELIRDKAEFGKHWKPELKRWFKDGVETPELVLIKVHAERINYWDGEDDGEVELPWATTREGFNARTMLGAGSSLSDV